MSNPTGGPEFVPGEALPETISSKDDLFAYYQQKVAAANKNGNGLQLEDMCCMLSAIVKLWVKGEL